MYVAPFVVWIDAKRFDRDALIFGLSPLERLLHSLREIDAPNREIAIDLPAEVDAALPLRWTHEGGDFGERFGSVQQRAGGGPLLALSADSVVDPRLIEHFIESGTGLALLRREGEETCALLWVVNPHLVPEAGDTDLEALTLRALDCGAVKEFSEEDFELYVRKLRRDLRPFLYRVSDAEGRRQVERKLFWANYKGSTDFLTKSVYPPLVWALLRPLGETSGPPQLDHGDLRVGDRRARPRYRGHATRALSHRGVALLDVRLARAPRRPVLDPAVRRRARARPGLFGSNRVEMRGDRVDSEGRHDTPERCEAT